MVDWPLVKKLWWTYLLLAVAAFLMVASRAYKWDVVGSHTYLIGVAVFFIAAICNIIVGTRHCGRWYSEETETITAGTVQISQNGKTFRSSSGYLSIKTVDGKTYVNDKPLSEGLPEGVTMEPTDED